MPRQFKLPNYEQLSKDQDKFGRWDGRGTKLVIGGPGTGKTTVALLLAKKMSNIHRKCLCLMFNNTLKHMSSQLTQRNTTVNTWHRWFCNFYQKQYKKYPPELNRWKYDWDEIEKKYLDNNNIISKDNKTLLIIDEGQDFPIQFYTFIKYHFSNILITADENQVITDNHSRVEEIAKCLEVSDDSIIDLTHNFRNTLQIACLGHHFYSQNVSKPTFADEVEREGEVPQLVKYNEFDKVIQFIVKRFLDYPNRLIGVIVNGHKDRERYYHAIQEFVSQYKENTRKIYTFASGKSNNEINYSDGGIAVFCAQSCKGLEFDDVFIGDLNTYFFHLEKRKEFRSKMYVLITRAIEMLFILYNTNNPNSNILNEFPDDKDLLNIKEN